MRPRFPPAAFAPENGNISEGLDNQAIGCRLRRRPGHRRGRPPAPPRNHRTQAQATRNGSDARTPIKATQWDRPCQRQGAGSGAWGVDLNRGVHFPALGSNRSMSKNAQASPLLALRTLGCEKNASTPEHMLRLAGLGGYGISADETRRPGGGDLQFLVQEAREESVRHA